MLAYVRRYRRDTLLIVNNLSGSSQPVELDLRAFAGSIPTEMLGGTRFPVIREAPYFLSLGPYGYYWFRLERREAAEPYGSEGTVI